MNKAFSGKKYLKCDNMTFHFITNFYPSKTEHWLSKAHILNNFITRKRFFKIMINPGDCSSILRKTKKLNIFVQAFWSEKVNA